MRNDQFLSAIASHSCRFPAGCLKKKATHQDCILYGVIEEVAEESIKLGYLTWRLNEKDLGRVLT
ncbi:hypothetical protein DY000_02008218 [Brassica cretica]|uniref:Uncharacterized protein n=1 Tax=Brassica cretica TaxID=69181 RepID=A0ABQ7BZ81_BRACR|nr:hypothetical protein DY000_02008218 [Brassica cretica]